MPTDTSGPVRSDDEVLDPPAKVAAMLGLTPRALEYWRAKGKGPRWIRLGNRNIRYRRSDVRAWLNTRETGGGTR